jgi:hypothetical protein
MASTLTKLTFFSALLLRTILGQGTTVGDCQALADVISICELETPAFTDLPATQQAECFCGSTLGTLDWGPTSFEVLASECAVEYATIDVTIASAANVLAGYCTEAGVQPQTTRATSTIDNCQVLLDVISICELETPSFTDLPATEQAECLCGSTLGTLDWGPASFDGLASECAIQYATIDVTIASDASALAGFCTDFGAQPQTSASPTPYTVKSTTARYSVSCSFLGLIFRS